MRSDLFIILYHYRHNIYYTLHGNCYVTSCVYVCGFLYLDGMYCIDQIWRQMPWEFEFSQELLQLLVFCYHSRYTMDFCYNNDAEQRSHFRVMLQEFETVTRLQQQQQQQQPCRELHTTVEAAPCGTSGEKSPLLRGHDNTSPSQPQPQLQPAADDGDPEKYLVSVWSYVSLHVGTFTNPIYKPSGKPPASNADELTTNATKDLVCALPAAAAMYSGGVVRSHAEERASNTPLLADPLHAGPARHLRREEGPRALSPSDDAFEFRSRTYAGVSCQDALGALKGLTAEDCFFDEEDQNGEAQAIKEVATDLVENDVATAVASAVLPTPNCEESTGKSATLFKNVEAKACRNMPLQKRNTKNIETGPADISTGLSAVSNTESVISKRWVHLLTPNWEVSELLLWEAVYYNGLALPAGVKVKAHTTVPPAAAAATTTTTTTTTSPSKTHARTPGLGAPGGGGPVSSSSFSFTSAASASLAYERGLDALCRRQQKQLRAQELELGQLRRLVANTCTTVDKGQDVDGQPAATTTGKLKCRYYSFFPFYCLIASL
jgi:hypothetical protein